MSALALAVLLVIVGASSYFAAAVVVGIGLVRYVGIPRHQQGRLRKLTIVPYFSAILLASRGGTAESTRNTTAVAVRPACDRWRSERAAVVAILHSARNGAEASGRTTCPELRVDWFGGSSGSPLCCRSGTRSNAAQLVRTKGVAIGCNPLAESFAEWTRRATTARGC